MFPSISLALFVVIANLPAFSQIPDAKQVREIHLSYIPWETLTRADLSVQQVRAHPHIRVTVKTKQSIQEILNSLPISQLASSPQQSADLRLVIDLLLGSGKTITFCSDGESFFTSDLQQNCKPNQKFFKKFDIKNQAQFK